MSASRAAKIWSEGNKKLEELLIYCIEHEIRTIGCCAGHHKTGKGGKIAFYTGDENTRKYILQLVSEMLENKALKDVEFTQGKLGTEVSLYSKEGKEDKLFSQLLEMLQEIVNGQEKLKNPTIKRIHSIVQGAYEEGRELSIDIQEEGHRFGVSSRIDKNVLTEEELFKYIECWKVRRKIREESFRKNAYG